MAEVIRKLEFTEEEKDILIKAKEIMQKISSGLGYETLEKYKYCEYITDILDISFEY